MSGDSNFNKYANKSDKKAIFRVLRLAFIEILL